MSHLTHRQKETAHHTHLHNGRHTVTPVTHHPYLGIELQSDLRNLKQVSTTVKSQAYKTIVRPQLEYASAIWDPRTAKDTHNLNKIQNYAARWVHHDYSYYTIVSSL